MVFTVGHKFSSGASGLMFLPVFLGGALGVTIVSLARCSPVIYSLKWTQIPSICYISTRDMIARSRSTSPSLCRLRFAWNLRSMALLCSRYRSFGLGRSRFCSGSSKTFTQSVQMDFFPFNLILGSNVGRLADGCRRCFHFRESTSKVRQETLLTLFAAGLDQLHHR